MLEQIKRTYPVVIDFPIQWGKMDAFNHVNNVTYFRYFESARIAYFERTPIVERMKTEGVGPILVSTECRYKRALTYPDRIRVGARIAELQSHGFVQEYAVYSEGQDAIVTEGNGRIVLLDYNTGKKLLGMLTNTSFITSRKGRSCSRSSLVHRTSSGQTTKKPADLPERL